MKYWIGLLLVAALSGCGLGETAATATAVGAGKAKESAEAQNTVQRTEEKLEAAQQQGLERNQAADQ